MFELTIVAGVLLAGLFLPGLSVVGFLFISMVLQAASVLNIHTARAAVSNVAAYGLTPFHVMAIIAGFLLMIRVIRVRQLHVPHVLYWPLGLLSSYVTVAVIGSWFLPRWFEGMPVHLLVHIWGAEVAPVPLKFTLSNPVQAVTLMALMVVLLYVLQATQSVRQRRRLLVGVFSAWLLVVLVGVYTQIAHLLNWPSITAYLSNNPGYSQVPLLEAGFPLARVGLPFSEPSYASAYLCAMTLGFWAVALRGRVWWWAGAAGLLSLLALVNTLGATGLAAAGVSLAFLWLWVLIKTFSQSATADHKRRFLVLNVALALMMAGSFWALKDSPVRPKIEAMVQQLIIHKAKQTDGSRELTNRRAMDIVKETHGLGVGMGSNRASSYFASMLSNTGVLGFGLFMAMLGSLLWRYWRAPALTDMQIFVAAALPSATFAMSLGIPDLNMPMYWGFIFLGFVFCPGNEAKKDQT
jgi:hypothetical protein